MNNKIIINSTKEEISFKDFKYQYISEEGISFTNKEGFKVTLFENWGTEAVVNGKYKAIFKKEENNYVHYMDSFKEVKEYIKVNKVGKNNGRSCRNIRL